MKEESDNYLFFVLLSNETLVPPQLGILLPKGGGQNNSLGQIVIQ